MCSGIPVDLGGELVDLCYGQLRPHGASYALIQAVRNADNSAIRAELLKIDDQENRDTLTTIIQQLGAILGSRR